MTKRNLIAGCRFVDGSLKKFDLTNPFFSAYSFCAEIGEKEIETLVFAEEDKNGNLLWEKTYSGGAVDHTLLAKYKKPEEVKHG